MSERERVQQWRSPEARILSLLDRAESAEAECARLRSALEDIAHPDWNSAMEQSELIKRIVTLARAALGSRKGSHELDISALICDNVSS